MTSLSQLLNDLYLGGREHDQREADRLNRWRNWPRATGTSWAAPARYLPVADRRADARRVRRAAAAARCKETTAIVVCRATAACDRGALAGAAQAAQADARWEAGAGWRGSAGSTPSTTVDPDANRARRARGRRRAGGVLDETSRSPRARRDDERFCRQPLAAEIAQSSLPPGVNPERAVTTAPPGGGGAETSG
jgi:hypothetical protein